MWLQKKGLWAVLGGMCACLVVVHLLEPISELYASPAFRVFQVFVGMLIACLPGLKVYLPYKNLWEMGAVLVALLSYLCPWNKVTLLDTAACGFLIYILSQNGNGAISRFLGSPGICRLGKLSLPIFLIHGPVLFILGRKVYAQLHCGHKGIVTGLICLTVTLLLSCVYLLAEKLVKRGNINAIKKTGAA